MSTFLKKVDSEITFARYLRNGERIAAGAFANVFQAVNRENGKVVAVVKMVNLHTLNSRSIAYTKNEV